MKQIFALALAMVSACGISSEKNSSHILNEPQHVSSINTVEEFRAGLLKASPETARLLSIVGGTNGRFNGAMVENDLEDLQDTNAFEYLLNVLNSTQNKDVFKTALRVFELISLRMNNEREKIQLLKIAESRTEFAADIVKVVGNKTSAAQNIQMQMAEIFLNHKVVEARKQALLALQVHQPGEIVPAVVTALGEVALHDLDMGNRELALSLFSRSASKVRHLKVFVSIVENEQNESIRLEAVKGIEKLYIKNKETIQRLIKIANKETNEEVREKLRHTIIVLKLIPSTPQEFFQRFASVSPESASLLEEAREHESKSPNAFKLMTRLRQVQDPHAFEFLIHTARDTQSEVIFNLAVETLDLLLQYGKNQAEVTQIINMYAHKAEFRKEILEFAGRRSKNSKDVLFFLTTVFVNQYLPLERRARALMFLEAKKFSEMRMQTDIVDLLGRTAFYSRNEDIQEKATNLFLRFMSTTPQVIWLSKMIGQIPSIPLKIKVIQHLEKMRSTESEVLLALKAAEAKEQDLDVVQEIQKALKSLQTIKSEDVLSRAETILLKDFDREYFDNYDPLDSEGALNRNFMLQRLIIKIPSHYETFDRLQQALDLSQDAIERRFIQNRLNEMFEKFPHTRFYVPR